MDEGKLGQAPSTPEFPPLTKEDLEEIETLYQALREKFPSRIPGMEFYTGTYESIGEGNIIYNSHMTLGQFCYALAMTRHPLIKEVSSSEHDLVQFRAKGLEENQVMKGIKILDLGCGPWPVFARCCRALGADVWTVDKIPPTDLYSKEELFTKKQKDHEIERHIQVDLSGGLAPRLIKERSAGDFHLVTAVQLKGGSFFEGRNVGWVLLKKGGVYYEVGSDPELKE